MAEPNPPENRNIDTGGGNYNERIEGNYIQGNVFQNIFNILGGQTTTPVGNPARPKNERILLAAVKEEVTSRLRQSLHNAVLINLGKESQPQQIKRPWDVEIKIGQKPSESLPDTTTILEVFDSEEIGGKLLILGAPGSGKTTTHLELAQELIKRAEEQSNYPVPVLFNLFSWKDDRQSLTDWLLTELKSKYAVSKKLAQEWIDNHQLLPLLDGLDELEAQRQELCVHVINQFLASENRPLYLVVCSRSEEYSSYSTELQLNGAIYLQPLTNHQIRSYLKAIKYMKLWSIIKNDLNLLELVKTPLLLSITVLASPKISVKEWQHLTSTANRIQYLLDAYIGQMLTQNITIRAYLKKQIPNQIKTTIWLVWLAQQMQIEAKTEFLIEEMQPSLLKIKTLKIIYNLMLWVILQILFLGLILGLILGLEGIRGLIGGLTLGLILGLIGGLTLGLINGLCGEILVDKLENTILINFNKIIIRWLIGGFIFGVIGGLIGRAIGGLIGILIFGLIAGLIAGMVFGLIGDKIEAIVTLKSSKQIFFTVLIEGVIYGLIFLLIAGQIFGLVAGLVAGLIFGLYSLKIENKTILKPDIWRSAINTVELSASLFLPSMILIFLNERIIQNNRLDTALFFSLIFGLLLGLLGGITRSGIPVIQHFILRLLLYFNGYIPWNYARFLNYCTERLFLQRVGGRYRFIHKLLQDHFAQM